MTETNRSERSFAIAREPAELSFDDFYARYYLPEQPVIIEGIAASWPACARWSEDHLQRALSAEPRAKASALWYWMDTGALQDDYRVPAIVEELYARDTTLPRAENLRIWIHRRGNISPWHFDANMINIFNVQISGSKEWLMLSPQTPAKCYPFSNYAIIYGDDERVLRDRIHTRFALRAGDMLYIPPCWAHKVIAQGEQNISLNWVMTNRETSVRTAGLEREQEIYAIQLYFRRHRYGWIRAAFEKVYFALPSFIRYRWRYQEFIRTPHRPTAKTLWKRVFKELAALGDTLRYAHRAYVALRSVAPVRRLDG